MCKCVGDRERKGQGYDNNDIQVHLGACPDFITALFKCNTTLIFFLICLSFTPVTCVINVKQVKRRFD